MSSLPIPSAVTATLPAVNIHPHGHGHRKGSLLDPTAGSSSNTAPMPVASTQNLFGSLFNALRQIIGARAMPAIANPAASIANAAVSSAAAGSAAAANSKINVMA